MAPSVGEETSCMEKQLASGLFPSDLKLIDNKLLPIEEQLKYLLSQADEFQNRLVYRCSERIKFTHIQRYFFCVKAYNPVLM